MKKLLLGDEAIAQGALDAGLSGVYAYPGTPSTEITEYIQNSQLAKDRNVHRRWATNEKTAMEQALGMSYMGKRALVCMKHVGLNVLPTRLSTPPSQAPMVVSSSWWPTTPLCTPHRTSRTRASMASLP